MMSTADSMFPWMMALLIAATTGCTDTDDDDPTDIGGLEGPCADGFFDDDGTVVEIEFGLEEGDLAYLDEDPLREEWVPGTFRCGDVTLEGVGLRYKGNSSLSGGGSKLPWKVDFDHYSEDQRFQGLEKLNFNNAFSDPSFLREEFGYAIFRDAGVVAGRTRVGQLTVNGEERGIFIIVEQVDDHFTEDRFGHEGELIKVFGATLTYLGDDLEPYQTQSYSEHRLYDFKHGEDEAAAYEHLINLCDVVSNTPAENLEAELEAVFDVHSWLTTLAVYSLTVNFDSYVSHGNNYYLYRDVDTGIFRFVPWDLNESFGTFQCAEGGVEDVEHSVHDPRCNPIAKPLIDRVLQVPAYQDYYLSEVERLLEGAFDKADLIPEIEARHEALAEYVHGDAQALYGGEAYDRSLVQDLNLGDYGAMPRMVPGLVTLIEQRHDVVSEQVTDPDPLWPAENNTVEIQVVGNLQLGGPAVGSPGEIIVRVEFLEPGQPVPGVGGIMHLPGPMEYVVWANVPQSTEAIRVLGFLDEDGNEFPDIGQEYGDLVQEMTPGGPQQGQVFEIELLIDSLM